MLSWEQRKLYFCKGGVIEMPKIALLNSNILSPGTKFTVTDDSVDSTIGPGTTGFISHVIGHDQDYVNVVYMRTTLIKRGKLGKERLDTGEMSVPVFDIKSDDMFKIMPDEKRRYYVHIEPLVPSYAAVEEMSDIEFIAWAQACAAYVRKLHGKAKQMTAWPTDGGDILNRMHNIVSYYGEDAETTKKEYGSKDIRDSFVRAFRLMESILIKCASAYKMKTIEIEERALNEINSQGVATNQKDIILANMDRLKKERARLLLIEAQRNKKQQDLL